MLFKMRYRVLGGVKEDFIDAKDLEQAFLIGQHVCNLTPRKTFISVNNAVIADASILEIEPPAEPVVTKPAPAERDGIESKSVLDGANGRKQRAKQARDEGQRLQTKQLQELEAGR